MIFSDVENRLLQLRRRLTVALGHDCIGEITVTKPDSSNQELAFLRLVVWSYAVLHENARVVLRFVNDLPARVPGNVLLPHVSALRTWLAHNMSFDKTRDVKSLQSAEAWLISACGTGSPAKDEEWARCSERLLGELVTSMDISLRACDYFAVEQDGPRLIEQLKHRVEREWSAYRFDYFAEQACRRLGYPEVDAPVLRAKHLDAWRKVISFASDEGIEILLQRRIEADVLSIMARALPVTAEVLDAALSTAEPPALAAALIVLRSRAGQAEDGPATYVNVVLRILSEQSQRRE